MAVFRAPIEGDGKAGPRLLAAAGIVAGALLVLVGALLEGATTRVPGGEGWKYAVKQIGLGAAVRTPEGVMLGGVLFVGVALTVALSLLGGASHGRQPLARFVVAGSAGAATWLVVLTVLGLIVDVTLLDHEGPVRVLGVILLDLAALAVLVPPALWGGRLLAGRQRWE